MTKNCNFIDKLRNAGLRPTKQRVKICEILFDREKTFHFTINDLAKKILEDFNEKISLATVYNTVHALQKKGYLKEIAINSDKSYFDTNTSAHHHFYDEDTHEYPHHKSDGELMCLYQNSFYHYLLRSL